MSGAPPFRLQMLTLQELLGTDAPVGCPVSDGLHEDWLADVELQLHYEMQLHQSDDEALCFCCICCVGSVFVCASMATSKISLGGWACSF
jgi:hypothetical protein